MVSKPMQAVAEYPNSTQKDPSGWQIKYHQTQNFLLVRQQCKARHHGTAPEKVRDRYFM